VGPQTFLLRIPSPANRLVDHPGQASRMLRESGRRGGGDRLSRGAGGGEGDAATLSWWDFGRSSTKRTSTRPAADGMRSYAAAISRYDLRTNWASADGFGAMMTLADPRGRMGRTSLGDGRGSRSQ
jgi:hypothetical protein